MTQLISVSTTKAVARLLRTKHTNQMTDEELAKVWAAHYGWSTREGGWVYDEKGTPVVQGWTGLARELVRRQYIKVGVGINWRLVPQVPRFKVAAPKRERSGYNRSLDLGLNQAVNTRRYSY
jgi:hypothetical protein